MQFLIILLSWFGFNLFLAVLSHVHRSRILFSGVLHTKLFVLFLQEIIEAAFYLDVLWFLRLQGCAFAFLDFLLDSGDYSVIILLFGLE